MRLRKRSADPIVPMKDNALFPPSELFPWLEHQYSLTQKLFDKTGDAQIEVLKQQWGVTDGWEQNYLKINQEKVFRRQILMRSYQIPCWYAKTIIPESTYNAEYNFFSRLQRETLGQLLFGDSSMKRIHYKIYRIDKKSHPFQWLPSKLTEGVECLWMRASTFTYKGKGLFFLLEILLPGLNQGLE